MKTTITGEYSIADYRDDELDQLKSVWRILERGADMTAFQFYDWYSNLNELQKKERTKNLFRSFHYILIKRKQSPVLIAPLEVHSIGIGYRQYGVSRGVHFIGRRGYTDYLNLVYDHFDPDAMEILIEYIRKTFRQNRLVFDRMLEATQSYQWMASHYRGYSIPETCAALYVPDSFEEYRGGLSKNARQNIRTALNRAKRNDLDLRHEFILDEDSAVKEQIRRINIQRLDKKKRISKKQMSIAGRVYCFFAEIYRGIFSARLNVLGDSKNTFAFVIKDGERIVSFFWGIRNDYLQEYYVILAGVDQEYEWYSPNISHLYLFIEECVQNPNRKIRVIDFTRGGEGYKKTIGCEKRAVSSNVFFVGR